MGSQSLTRLHPLLTLILLLSLTALCAKLSWQLLALGQIKAPLPQVFRAVQAPRPELFGDLQLFALQQAKSVRETLDKTSLALSITGILLSEDPLRSQVILRVENQQKVLMLGDRLPLAGEVVLSDIQRDKILLNNNGKMEYLGLSQMLQDIEIAPKREETLQVKLAQTEFASEAQQFRHDLRRDPLSLARFIKLVPRQLSDGMRGYTLEPGLDQRLYRALPLQPDDILLSLNGIPVTKPSKLIGLPSSINSNEPIKLGMLRDGQPLTFLLYL
ncbi:MAG: type II secretion system protein GspC [Pseudomonadales bacterium]